MFERVASCPNASPIASLHANKRVGNCQTGHQPVLSKPGTLSRHGLGQGPVQQGGLDQGGWLRSPASNMGDDGSTQRGWYFLDGSQGRGGGRPPKKRYS